VESDQPRYVQQSDAGFVLSEKADRQYAIIFDGSGFAGNDNSCVIPVKSRREVELLLLSLGEEAGVIMDEQARKLYPDVWDWLYGRTYSEIFTDLKWSYREEDEVVDLIERIPLPGNLSDSFLKIDNEDPEPERIDKEYVHKTNQENVLISKPYRCGNMFYFNGFSKSAEFNIDHGSDHLEGIIIFEAARQAVIASVHLAGKPLSGIMVILKTTTRYTKFVECGEPCLICTIPVIKQRGGYSFCSYNIVQKGYSCATGYITGIVYKTKEAYKKFRNAKFIAKASNEKAVGMQLFSE
jgi:hypothetical protein